MKTKIKEKELSKVSGGTFNEFAYSKAINNIQSFLKKPHELTSQTENVYRCIRNSFESLKNSFYSFDYITAEQKLKDLFKALNELKIICPQFANDIESLIRNFENDLKIRF